MSQFPRYNSRRVIHPTVPSSFRSQDDNNLISFQDYEIGYVDEYEDEFNTPKEQLNYALEEEKSAIIIRDKSVGIRTVLWIVLGKGMRYLAVVTAIGSIVSSCGTPEGILGIAKPLAFTSLVLNLGYFSVWHRSPLMKYKQILNKFSIAEVSCDDPLRSSEEQLSDALSARRSVVIIKDKEYGRRILLWMAFGRGVHKSALATATGSILCATVMNEKFLVFAKPLALGSVALNFAYHVVWHRTPLMHYRIAPQCSVLQAVKNNVKTNTIIVEKTVEYRTDIACCISVVASTLAFWSGIKSLNIPDKLFRSFKKLGQEA